MKRRKQKVLPSHKYHIYGHEVWNYLSTVECEYNKKKGGIVTWIQSIVSISSPSLFIVLPVFWIKLDSTKDYFHFTIKPELFQAYLVLPWESDFPWTSQTSYEY